LAALLAERIASLAVELMPNGHKNSRYWRCGSLAGERGQSLAVTLWGPKQGRWFDYAAGEGGDALDLVAGVKFAGDKREAFRWARDWLNLPERQREPIRRLAQQRPPIDENYSRAIERIWLESRQLERGDPVDRYLTGRGIVLAELGRAPGALRFHPNLWNSQTKRSWPAMVAAITAPDGAITAVHCTWLAADPIAVTKAPIPDRHGPTGGAKRTLGPYRGGCVHLWRGDSGKRWSEMRENEILMVGEGIEDTLSAVFNRSAWRAACAVALSSMFVLELPLQVGTVVILAQNDRPDSDAAKLLRKVAKRWVDEGRKVRIVRPPVSLKDWNDVAVWGRKTKTA
jgi:hypothetical protein